jgi:deoxyhypusine synthase
MASAPPTKATDAVLVSSEPIPDGVLQVKGIDWAALPDEQRAIISNFVNQVTGQGFQSSSIGDAIRIINEMVGDSYMRLYEAVLTAFRDPGETPKPVTKQQSSSGIPPT